MIKTKKKNIIFSNKYIELQNNNVVDINTNNEFDHIKLIENNSNYPGSVILCKHNNKFLLLENYRYGINDISIELPRGYRDKHEPLEECAIRELKEETNIIFDFNIDRIQKLGEIAVNSAILESKVALFLIEINQPINNLQIQSYEHISSCYWLDLNTINDYILEGKIIDSFTINTLMFFHLRSNCL